MHNELFTMGSLFTEANKEKIIQLLEQKFNEDHKEEGLTYEDFSGHVIFKGISISKTNLIAHYNVYNGLYIYLLYQSELPLTGLRHLLRDKYAWLLGKTVKGRMNKRENISGSH